MGIYLVIDDYTPDAGSTIYGAFASHELAEAEVARLSSDDNEYGCNMNEADSLDIRSLTVEGEVKS